MVYLKHKKNLVGVVGLFNDCNIQDLIKIVNNRMMNIKNTSIKEDCPIGIIDFNLWEWPQGVGLYGMFKYYKETTDKKYLNFLIKWFEDRIAEGLPSKNVNTMAPMLTLAHIYEETGNPNYLELCKEWAEWIMKEMPRTKEDGLQHVVSGWLNEGQLWDDTLFMTVLFLGKIGMILNNQKYKDEAYYQFLIHSKYLVDNNTGLWYHGWTFVRRDNFGKALWGRGNCWITVAIPEFIEIMDLEEYQERFLVNLLHQQIIALKKFQDSSGMWHTLIDDPDSYLETSATAGFAYGILKAVRLGFVPEMYKKVGLKAVDAVINKISHDGTVEGVSYGTGVSNNLKTYKEVAICPMAYGQSLTALMLSEVLLEQLTENGDEYRRKGA